MPRSGRSRPSELGASWATEDYNDDRDSFGSDSDADVDNVSLSDSDDSELGDQHTPIRRQPRAATTSARSERFQQQQQQTFDPQGRGAAPQFATSTPVRHPSQRVRSREASFERSLIMPSMQGDSMDGSFLRTSPMNSSQRSPARARLASASGSQYGSPLRGQRSKQQTPSREAQGIRRRKQTAAYNEGEAAFEADEDQPWVVPVFLWTNIFHPVVDFMLSIFKMALTISKPFIAWILMAWVLFIAITYLQNSARSAVHNALSPLCFLPGTSSLSFCAPSQGRPSGPGDAEFEQLLAAQSSFEEVFKSSAEIASLPYDMKRSEASIRDLRTVVKYSSLPSRNELDFELETFIRAAQQASGDLQAFDSRVGRAIDAILSTNRWTMNVLSQLISDEASRGSIERFFAQINPISALFSSSRDPRDILLTQYITHTRAVEDQVAAVIAEAQGLQLLLRTLDERLDSIASVATRDGITIKGSRDELLSSLWTKLGGNRAEKSRLEQHMVLLRSVGSYQRVAWEHVSATILKLQAIASQLEDLRERVAAPGVVGTDTVPLEVHIENIKLGVERLEGVRGESRRLQGDIYRKLVRGAGGGPSAVDGKAGAVTQTVIVS